MPAVGGIRIGRHPCMRVFTRAVSCVCGVGDVYVLACARRYQRESRRTKQRKAGGNNDKTRPSNKKSQSGGLCVNRQRDSTESKAQNEEPCSAPAAISLAGTKMVKTLFGASAQPQVLPSNICRARMRHTGRKRAQITISCC